VKDVCEGGWGGEVEGGREGERPSLFSGIL